MGPVHKILLKYSKVTFFLLFKFKDTCPSEQRWVGFRVNFCSELGGIILSRSVVLSLMALNSSGVQPILTLNCKIVGRFRAGLDNSKDF